MSTLLFETDHCDPFESKDFQERFKKATGLNFFYFVKKATVRLVRKSKRIENDEFEVKIYPQKVTVEKVKEPYLIKQVDELRPREKVDLSIGDANRKRTELEAQGFELIKITPQVEKLAELLGCEILEVEIKTPDRETPN